MIPYVQGLSFDIPLLQNIIKRTLALYAVDIPSMCCSMKVVTFVVALVSGCRLQ